MDLLLKGLLSGALVVGIQLAARRSSPALAGVLLLVPVVAVCSYALIGARSGAQRVSEVALASLLALPVLAVFSGAVWLLAGRFHWPWPLALGVSLVLWVAGAALFVLTRS